MENYDRDSLRNLRKEMQQANKSQKSNRWITFVIILLFLLAGGFFLASGGWLKPFSMKETFSKWTGNLKSASKEENDITKTVDAVLARQNEAV